MKVRNQYIAIPLNDNTDLCVSVDSYVARGKRHERDHTVCQDYAATGVISDGCPTLVVADGCSASLGSELGAMLNCHMWMTFASTHRMRYPDMTKWASIWKFNYIRSVEDYRSGGLMDDGEGSIFDATMLSAMFIPSMNSVILTVQGDGAWLAVYEKSNGELVYCFDYLTWKTGMPPYPSYALDNDRMTAYWTHSQKLLSGRAEGVWTASETEGFLKVTSSVALSDVLPVGALTDNFGLVIELPRLRDEPDGQWKLKTFSVFTDGVLDIRHENELPLYINYPAGLVKDLTDYKSTAGDFQFRRCRAFFKGLAVDGVFPEDDFSVATMLFEERRLPDGDDNSGNA